MLCGIFTIQYCTFSVALGSIESVSLRTWYSNSPLRIQKAKRQLGVCFHSKLSLHFSDWLIFRMKLGWRNVNWDYIENDLEWNVPIDVTSIGSSSEWFRMKNGITKSQLGLHLEYQSYFIFKRIMLSINIFGCGKPPLEPSFQSLSPSSFVYQLYIIHVLHHVFWSIICNYWT